MNNHSLLLFSVCEKSILSTSRWVVMSRVLLLWVVVVVVLVVVVVVVVGVLSDVSAVFKGM